MTRGFCFTTLHNAYDSGPTQRSHGRRGELKGTLRRRYGRYIFRDGGDDGAYCNVSWFTYRKNIRRTISPNTVSEHILTVINANT